MTVLNTNYFRSLMPDGTIFVDLNGNRFSLKEETKPIKTKVGNIIGKNKKGKVLLIKEDCEYSTLKEGEILIVPAKLANNKSLKFETDIAGATEATHIKGQPVENIFFIHRAHQRSSSVKIWQHSSNL